MEGNLPIRVISHGSMDLQGSMHLHQPQNLQNSNHHQQQQQQLNHSQNPTVYDVFPLSSSADYYKGDNFKVSMSDEDDPSFNTEDRADGQAETLKGKKGSPWQRVKWTDVMVRLLITALSYIGEEDSTTECDNGRRRKFTVSQKIGKWKAISKVMAERGYYVSPQQCEDKFNDLNKRYKRLNDILGRGTSCQVVENPALLDIMHHVSDKSKDDVRKILSSKQLFYEEMCSYHNGNRLHLPADASLHRSLLLALSNRDHHDRKRILREEAHEDDQSTDSEDGDDDTEENNTLYGGSGVPSCLPKRMKQGVDHDHDLNRRPHQQDILADMNQAFPEGSNNDGVQRQWLRSRSLHIEEQRLHLQAQMLELEKQRFKWQRFSKKKDRELDKMKIENEKMRLENERMELELKHKELEIDLN